MRPFKPNAPGSPRRLKMIAIMNNCAKLRSWTRMHKIQDRLKPTGVGNFTIYPTRPSEGPSAGGFLKIYRDKIIRQDLVQTRSIYGHESGGFPVSAGNMDCQRRAFWIAYEPSAAKENNNNIVAPSVLIYDKEEFKKEYTFLDRLEVKPYLFKGFYLCDVRPGAYEDWDMLVQVREGNEIGKGKILGEMNLKAPLRAEHGKVMVRLRKGIKEGGSYHVHFSIKEAERPLLLPLAA